MRSMWWLVPMVVSGCGSTVSCPEGFMDGPGGACVPIEVDAGRDAWVSPGVDAGPPDAVVRADDATTPDAAVPPPDAPIPPMTDACTASLYYVDSDLDGYGDASDPGTLSCTPVADRVRTNTDCNDREPGISPRATEVCNDLDDDCDTRVDEALPAMTYYVDGDMDRVGGGAAQMACRIPTGGVTVGGDCNDADRDVSPLAPERCNGRDDTCNGTPDETFACVQNATNLPCATSCGSAGRRSCSADCMLGMCMPPSEICNGIDEDCVGGADNGFACVQNSTGNACRTSCDRADEARGTYTCSSACTVGTCNPPVEVCNGRDDDCVAGADNGFACVQNSTGNACATRCGTAGTYTCSSSCTVGTCNPPVEVCNGIDEDCDGFRDEDLRAWRSATPSAFGVQSSMVVAANATHFIYATGFGGYVQVTRRDASGGSPSSPIRINSPSYKLAITTTERTAYIANFDGGEVTVYAIDLGTWTLSSTSTTEFYASEFPVIDDMHLVTDGTTLLFVSRSRGDVVGYSMPSSLTSHGPARAMNSSGFVASSVDVMLGESGAIVALSSTSAGVELRSVPLTLSSTPTTFTSMAGAIDVVRIAPIYGVVATRGATVVTTSSGLLTSRVLYLHPLSGTWSTSAPITLTPTLVTGFDVALAGGHQWVVWGGAGFQATTVLAGSTSPRLGTTSSVALGTWRNGSLAGMDSGAAFFAGTYSSGTTLEAQGHVLGCP